MYFFLWLATLKYHFEMQFSFISQTKVVVELVTHAEQILKRFVSIYHSNEIMFENVESIT